MDKKDSKNRLEEVEEIWRWGRTKKGLVKNQQTPSKSQSGARQSPRSVTVRFVIAGVQGP